MNINNGRQSIDSFIFSHTNSNIDRPMVENSRASKSKVFIGVLSKFPQLKRSILQIAMSILLSWNGQLYDRWIAAEQLAGSVLSKL